MQILNEETDEEHPITISEVIDRLSSMGIFVTRKTVIEDIEQLVEFGIDIVCVKSTQNRYFVGERSFELPELKLLVDAVESSRFITRKKSKTLIGKLSKLASKFQSTKLNRQVYVAGRIKSENELVYYIIDLLHTAIHEQKQIEFKYYEYNEQKKKVLKHGGKIYKLSAYALTWNDDQYYVFGFSESHNKIVKFRVDRIHNPKVTVITAVPKSKDFDVVEFSKTVFNMYDGEEQQVELLCDANLMKIIVDKFGKDINTVAIDKNTFSATVRVSTSPTFYGWVFGFAGQMRILSPTCVKEEYKRLAKNVCCD